MQDLHLKVEYVPIDSVAPDPANAKEHPDWQVEEIANSIDQFGMDDPIGVAGAPPTIIEGHGRLLACKRLGMEKVPIIRLDHLDAQARKAYMLAHNQLTMNTGFDMDALQATMGELTDFDMSDFGFDMGGFDGTGGGGGDAADVAAGKTLAERFGVPPFSVLNAQRQSWIERKRAWIATGLRSEIGRGGDSPSTARCD